MCMYIALYECHAPLGTSEPDMIFVLEPDRGNPFSSNGSVEVQSDIVTKANRLLQHCITQYKKLALAQNV
jgi:hypothetical protein